LIEVFGKIRNYDSVTVNLRGQAGIQTLYEKCLLWTGLLWTGLLWTWSAVNQRRNEGGGASGENCPRAQDFGDAKLRSECYVLITKCQMSADANNCNLQNVECHCEISSRSSRFAKRAIM